MVQDKKVYVAAGSGDPVILLHSSMSSRLQWKKLMEELSGRYFTVAPDLYGYGETPFPPNKESFSLMDEVVLVEAVLEAENLRDRPVHFVGHSYGAVVALRFCLKNPGNVRSLSLFEPVAFHLLPDADEALGNAVKLAQGVDFFFHRDQYRNAARFFIDYWNGEGAFDRLEPELQEIFSGNIRKLPLDFHAIIGEQVALHEYADIMQPVCLITGSRSPVTSLRVSELLAQTLPHCEVVTVEGNHMAPITSAETVNGVIREFLSRF